MKIPSYIKIGYAKGYCKETNEWVYGWHWTSVPYTCFDEGQKIKHFIRVQINHDWNLTEQKDYEVEAKSVGYYIGVKDKNSVPIFLGDRVIFLLDNTSHTGVVGYDTSFARYIVYCKDYNIPFKYNDFSNLIVIGGREI